MSVTCDQLSAFMDGELSVDDLDEFRVHFAACEGCARGLGDGWLIEQRLLALGRAQRVESRLVGLVLALLFAAGAVGVWMAGDCGSPFGARGTPNSGLKTPARAPVTTPGDRNSRGRP